MDKIVQSGYDKLPDTGYGITVKNLSQQIYRSRRKKIKKILDKPGCE